MDWIGELILGYLVILQDPPEVHVCGYSGRKFILKKYYDEKVHGPSITYDEYLKEMDSQPKDYPA